MTIRSLQSNEKGMIKWPIERAKKLSRPATASARAEPLVDAVLAPARIAAAEH